MKQTIIEQIEKEIERLLEELGKVDPSSKDYEELVSRIGDLYQTLNKEGDLKTRNDEKLIKFEEIRQSKILGGIKMGIDIASIVAPLVFYGIWMSRGLEFEKEGTFTSSTFKGLISKFKPTK